MAAVAFCAREAESGYAARGTQGLPDGLNRVLADWTIVGDEGKTFSAEEPISKGATGVCGCCACRAFADSKGAVFVLYRSATGGVVTANLILEQYSVGGAARCLVAGSAVVAS